MDDVKHILSNPYHEVLRFNSGDDVLRGILDFAEKQGIEAAWLSAIGSVQDVELGFYDLKKQEYLKKNFDEAMELLEASGTIAVMNGKPMLHVHGVFGGKNYETLGGHIHRMIASAAVEVFIHKIDGRLERRRDPQTGLNLLDLD